MHSDGAAIAAPMKTAGRCEQLSIPLLPRNHTPHPTARLLTIPLPPRNQMPVRMKHRLPRHLA